MAIVKLEKMQLIGLKSNLAAVINFLSKQGCSEIRENTELAAALEAHKQENRAGHVVPESHAFKEAFIKQINNLALPQTQKVDVFDLPADNYAAFLTECTQRIEFLDKQIALSGVVKPVKSPMFKLRDEVDKEVYLSMRTRQEELLQSAKDFAELYMQKEQLQLTLNKENGLAEQLKPFRNLHVSQRQEAERREAEHFAFLLGSLRNREHFLDLQPQLDNLSSPCVYEELELAEPQEQVVLLLAVEKDGLPELEKLLSAFAFKALPTLNLLVPHAGVDLGQTYQETLQTAEKLTAQINTLMQQLRDLTVHTQDWRILADFYRVQQERLQALCKLSSSEKIFVLEAFVPSKLKADLYNELEANYCVTCNDCAIGEDEKVPVMLSNCRQIRPYESVIEEFSMPDYHNDIDPTWILAPCYAFFFGAMLSDIGYGLIFFIAAMYLLLKNKVEGNARRFMWIFAGGGFFAILWGLAFGSFFGDLPSAITNGAFTLKPLFADPFKEPMIVMGSSVVLGMAHIACGMLLNMYKLCRNGDPRAAFTEIAPWFFIFGGIGVSVAGISWGKWMSLIAVCVIVFLSKKNSRNPIVQLITGILKLYDITGFVGDILSYTRITALVLSTSVIAMVVNMFAKMIGFGFPNIIVTLLILLLGHTMNIALSGLSAYVHTTRLHYVEFFGRFYDGGGDLFRPLSIHTKYTREKQVTKSLVERLRCAVSKN